MKGKRLTVWLASVALAWGTGGWALAQEEEPVDEVIEAPEEEMEDPIDEELEAPGEETDVVPDPFRDLSERYGVNEERITQMRSDGMGFGEMNIALAISERIAADSAETETPVTIDSALDGVLAERADGKGWGEIAQDHGFNVGDVVRDAGKERPERGARPQRLEKPDRPDKPQKPDKPDRPDLEYKPGRGLGR